MFNNILNFVINYKYVFLFYLLIIIFLIIKRKKIEIQAKFIVLYRMKFGLKFIDKCTNKFREWFILLGYVGVGAGYTGMIFISYMLIKGLWDLIYTPAAASSASIIYPGMKIAGIGTLSFDYFVLVIFFVALIHEFGHGILARAHNIPVKNTGMVLFGPIIGAFVEPDEKKLRKQSDIAQYSVLAAGPFANILLAVLALGLLSLVFMPLQMGMVEPTGFIFDSYVEGDLPFAKAGIMPGTLITGLDGKETPMFEEFAADLFCTSPGDKVVVNAEDKDYQVTLAPSPDVEGKSFLGIQEISNQDQIKEKYTLGIWPSIHAILNWITGFLKWLFLLSLGIGLFNLLPLPIVDGGRMLQVSLHKLKGKEKGEKRYRQITIFFLFVLVLNLVYPWIRGLFGI
jgi:membrane-associated protease RseP (regulator of RpoE activity)